MFDISEEEEITAKAIEEGMDPDQFNKTLETEINPLDLLLGNVEMPSGELAQESIKSPASLFENDFEYMKTAVEFLKSQESLQATFNDETRRIEFTAPKDLEDRFKYLPKEIWPENGFFILSNNQETIQKEIKRSRKDEHRWPRIHYLWELHPTLTWINDKVTAAFGRNQAPVLLLPEYLEDKQAIFIISALIPNRKSHPLLHHWLGVSFKNNQFESIMTFEELQQKIGLGKKQLPNAGVEFDTDKLQSMLPVTIQKTREWMSAKWKTFEDDINKQLDQQLKALEKLRSKQYVQLELDFGNVSEKAKQTLSRKDAKKRQIDRTFDEFITWVEDTMTTENNPYIQVVAALKGKD
ncbi:MAG: hypothetical protein KAR20_21250 [Candidatus Heimdallarchaeota archaeon]|nr:hypothetical protein [Candidatus Heimdallarchaeota archaeon]